MGGVRDRPPIGASEASRIPVLEAFVLLGHCSEADVTLAAGRKRSPAGQQRWRYW
jgi:hypothetical protein